MQASGNYPEESMQHSEHGESFKPTTFHFINHSTDVNTANTLTYGIIVQKPKFLIKPLACSNILVVVVL